MNLGTSPPGMPKLIGAALRITAVTKMACDELMVLKGNRDVIVPNQRREEQSGKRCYYQRSHISWQSIILRLNVDPHCNVICKGQPSEAMIPKKWMPGK